jgi:solute carrier family 25 (mitochondrial folate transporter), member 32
MAKDEANLTPVHTKKKANTFQHLISGMTAGIVTTVCLHPLDLIKTRFQVYEGNIGRAHKKAKYRSTWHGLRTIVYNEGVSALYQGISPAIFGSGSSWGLYFFFYETYKKQNKFLLDGNNFYNNKTFLNLCSSTQAGVTTVFITNPIWLVKTRMQVQDKSLHNAANEVGGTSTRQTFYRSMPHAFKTIVQEEGFFALYRGLLPALFLVSHGVIQFVVYEELKTIATNDGTAKLGLVEPLWMGAMSKTIASTATYPWQTIKSRIQQRQKLNAKPYNGMIDCGTRIIKNEGIRGLYKGLAPNLIRIAPSAAITFFTYENVKEYLIKNNYF